MYKEELLMAYADCKAYSQYCKMGTSISNMVSQCNAVHCDKPDSTAQRTLLKMLHENEKKFGYWSILKNGIRNNKSEMSVQIPWFWIAYSLKVTKHYFFQSYSFTL